MTGPSTPNLGDKKLAGAEGLEPPTGSLENCCSIRLSYAPKVFNDNEL